MRIFIIFVGVFMLATTCVAQDNISFEISVDKTQVSMGDIIQLSVTVHGTQDVSIPSTPEIEGFRVRYIGPATRMSIVNGRVTQSISYVYHLLPTRLGRFEIGPFSLGVEGRRYTSNAVVVEVYSGAVPKSAMRPDLTEEAQEGLQDRVFLAMDPEKREAYVNEIVSLSVKLYVGGLSMRDISFPEFKHEGLSVSEFQKPDQYPRVMKGKTYEVLEFKTQMFGTRPGKFVLSEANIKGNLIVPKQRRRVNRGSVFDDFFDDNMFSGFFDRYEVFPLDLKSEAVDMTIMALPEAGKPQAFNGAVGNFDFTVNVQPAEVKLGDPITVTVSIQGAGNFNTVKMPKLESYENFKAYEPEVTKQDDSVKVFKQIIIPKDTNIKEVSKINLCFFDPNSKAYKTVSKGPFPINVIKPEKEERLKIVEMPTGTSYPIETEILGRDIIFIKGTAGSLVRRGDYLYKNSVFLLFQLMPALALAAVFFMRKRTDKLRTDIKYARSLRASKEAREGLRQVKRALDAGDPAKFYDQVFKTMQEYLGDKFHLPSAGITIDTVDKELSGRNVKEDILGQIKDVFSECDMARYALSKLGGENMKMTFNKVRDVIGRLERIRVS